MTSSGPQRADLATRVIGRGEIFFRSLLLGGALVLAARAQLPEAPTVVQGNVTVNTTPAQMTVTQTTTHGIVNWNSFSIGAGQGVHFNNGSGATLNRVTGLTASQIDGSLTATGSLFLLNKNGIIIGADGRVLTGGTFVASTRDITDADFLNGGGFTLFGDNQAGVTNLGKISSIGGDVLLAGYTATNRGTIAADAGRVGLTAGQRVDVLTDVSWLGGAYAVSLGERGNDVTNEGRVQSLIAELRTHNGNIYALAGNNTGLIQATGVKNEGGKVILTAESGTVQSTGTITATRADASGVVHGGDIEITAASVENYGGTQDVSGATGGTIRLTADAITTDTAMRARASIGAGGTVAIEAGKELLFTSAGVIDASGATRGGEIALDAGAGHAVLSGSLTASGGTTGGRVSVWGDRLALLGATIAANGGTQGGGIFIGGGYQGGALWRAGALSPLRDSFNAQRTYVSNTTTLSADATGSAGAGGTVVAWADGVTEFAGAIFARGGTASGDGGLVETSGLVGLGVSGTVDASARGEGANGRWLLDPKNITIGTVTDSRTEFQTLTQGFGAQPWDLQANVRFGASLDLSGETLIVGGSARAAYIFESGRIAARLTTPTPYDGLTAFGNAVRIEGDIAAVADSSYNASFIERGSGAVYLFAKGTGWRNGAANFTSTVLNPFATFTPERTLNTIFASSLELTKDAGGQVYLAIPDEFYRANGFDSAGVVWSAPISAAGVAAPLRANLATTPYAFGAFGTKLVVSNGYAFVGDTSNSALTILHLGTGSAQRHTNVFSAGQSATLAVSGDLLFATTFNGGVEVNRMFGNYQGFEGPRGISFNSNNTFANVMAVAGDTMVLGTGANGFAGSVTIFQAPTGGWLASTGTNPATEVFRQVGQASSPTGNQLYTSLGAALALEGDYLAVGMPGLDINSAVTGPIADLGGVLTLRRTNGTWTADAQTLAPANPSSSTTYGQEIAADGNTLIVSDDRFDDQFTIGESKRGRVYVYENGALAATLSGIPGLGLVFDGFGDKIDLDGDLIVATTVYSFNGNPSGTFGRLELFAKGSAWRNGTANRLHFTDFIGEIGSVSLDGTNIAIGVPVPGAGQRGRVFLYGDITAGFRNWSIIQNPFGAANVLDYFGNTVALSGNTLAVGQPRLPNAGQFASNLFFVTEDYSSAGLTDYNVFLFENLANNWERATSTRLRGADILNPSQDSVGWGYSLALDGDTLVTGYGRDAQAGTSRGVYVFQRNGTWANSTTPVARLTGSARNFGFDVDIRNDVIAVSSPNYLENYVYGSPTSTDSPIFVFQRQNGWQSGTTNLVSTFLPAVAATNRSFGNSIALNDQALFASSLSNRVGASSTMPPVFQFNGPFGLDARATFASGPGANLAISAAALTNSLSLGTNITLQANNDITISQPITVNNLIGDGGDLTLSAGRRILVNASIFTDNGDLTLIASDPRANATFRDAGERVVVLGRDTTNTGVTLNLGTGNLLINAADRFENRTGSTSPFVFSTVNPGRYLVYATTPNQTGAPDATNLLADLATTNRNWVYYNRTFDVANLTPSWLPAGNGFIYSVQPALNVSVGNASITYGQSVTANLSLTGLTLGGNAVSQSVFGITSADLPNLVTTGLANTVPLSAGGFAHAGTYTGGITATAKSTVTAGSVYGVAVTTGTAGNLTVAKANLTVTPDNATRVYRSSNPTFTFNYTGFVAGDNASVIDTAPSIATTATTSSNVGTYTIAATGGLDNNYTLVPTGTALLSITPFTLNLTGLSGVNRTYDGTTNATFAGTPTIAPLGGDAVSLSGLLTATASFADRNVGTNKPITLTGFGLTGAQAGNYTLALPTNLTASITPATLTVGGLTVPGRVYDGTTTATVTGTATVTPIGGDVVTLDGTPTVAFVDENAAANKPVTLAGLTLAGTHATNYVLATPNLTAAITPRPLDITGLTANNRVYNATTAATLSGTATIAPIAGDVVALAGTATASFANKNVGTAKPVNVFGFTLTGGDAANYALNQPTGLLANITPASLSLTGISIATRVYDATTIAQVLGTAIVAALGSDQVAVTGTGTANFADKNVGTGKAVTVSGYTLAGTDAANYTLALPTGLTGAITARALTVSGLLAANKVYDATNAATVTGTALFSGVLSGDTATINASTLGYAFADKNVGTAKAITISGVTVTGADAANYDATQFGLTADITPATLTVTGATAASRLYNATNLATITGGTLQGVLGSDVITFNPANAAGTFADKNVGTAKAVTVTGYAVAGTDAGNYTLVQPTGLTADITPFTLSLVGLSGDKTYDGTTAAPLTFTGLDGVFARDTVTVDASAVSATYADKNAGANKAVTITGLFGLTGLDANNYLLTQPASLFGTILRRGITVTGLTIADKVYDGTITGVISGTGTFGGTIAGDELSINVGAINVTFADKHVGTNKAVALSGVTLSGADADNYTAATPTGITASITAKDLTVTGLAALDKVYDRTTTATLTGTGALQGTITDDVIALNESARAGTFSDKNVGTAKTVAVGGLTLTGTDARNYRLIAPTLTANITPATATLIGLTAVNRVYDATAVATFAGLAALDFGALNNVLASAETVSLAGTATGSFASKNVGANKAVTVDGVSLAGTDATNYTLALPTTLTANVTPADLAITGVVVANKTYDATPAATITTPGTVTALARDTVQLTGTAVATFADKNVAANKAVAVTGYTLSGDDAANYTLLAPTGVTATITRANLALTGVVADNKVYDGTTTAPLSGRLTIAPLGTDVVSVTGTPSATFANKNAGTAKPVTLSGLSLTGTDATNYNFVLPALTANITPRNVLVGGLTALNRVYDGTTLATLAGSATLANVVNGDNLAFNLAAITASFGDKNAGANKRVTLGGNGLTGTDASNYTQVLPLDLVATITARALQILGVDAVNRIYDRTTTVALTGGTLSNAVAGDAVSLVTTSATGTMADKNVGVNKPVTAAGYTVTGADAANYTVTQPTGIDVTVTPQNIEITGLEVADKLFDGTTSATISGGTLAGTISGDELSLVTTGASARFADALVGNDKPVQLVGFTLSGADAANYQINPAQQIIGRILPALRDITEVVPAEVLRAASNQALENQRSQLEAFARAQPDRIQITNFANVVEQATTGLVLIPINRGILDTPPDQQDPLTRNYIAAAFAADAANNNLQNQAIGFRIAAAEQRETGRQLNETVNALEVERTLRGSLVDQFERVNTQLAVAERNLAAIADAKRNVADYTRRLAEAERLGRSSEVAEYQRILDAARAIVATESATLAQRDALVQEAARSRAAVEAQDRRISELDAKRGELTTKLADVEARLANVEAAMESAKATAAAAATKLAEAQAAGERAFASDTTMLRQADSLEALATSDLPAKTAAVMVESDPFVKQFEAKATSAAQVTATIGQGLATNLSPAALAYAKSVAEKINSGGVLDDSAAMRNALVKSVPALQALQTQLDAAEQRQARESAAFESLVTRTAEARASVMRGVGITLTPQQIAADAAAEKARLNNRLMQLTGGALDLSKVPTKNADGEALTELERMSIAILNKQLNTPQGAASEVGTFAAGYKDRLNEAVAEEFGFSPEQALNDPTVLAKEVVARQPFNADGSIDKEQLAENLKVAASAYVNLNGALKDEAIKQAAEQDPTGAAQAYVGAEKAARDEFVKTYGGQPEDVITDRINARIDAYKNADSPEALMRVHAASMLPGGEMTIEAATKAYNDLKAGKSPDAVAKEMASNLWNGSGEGPSAREQAVTAARTAQAMEAAAISSLEEADKTGLFKASNTINDAASEEFAKTFGGTPQELGIKALEDPAAAANQVANTAKDLFTTPDGALNAVKGGISTYSNMADATLNAAKQQLDVVGAKFGGPGKAAAFIAKHGITAATEVKDFLQDAASTVTFGLIEKSGPSQAEVEAAVAFAKAQEEVARAESQKREDQMLLQYFAAAQELAQRKAQMAAGVVNAKAQVGQFLVAAQAQAKQEETAAIAKQTVTAEFTRVVQTGLKEKAEAARSQVNVGGLSTAEMEAKAKLWRGGQ